MFYPTPPSTDEPNWENYQQADWIWPSLTHTEVRDVCKISKSTSPGDDTIDWSTISHTCEYCPDRFVKFYQTYIHYDYHPKCWKKAIRIILHKPKKEDYSIPKAYRVISLLNCLGKVAEKLLATRLAWLAETSNLLHQSQIGGRKQKSTIDAAMQLVHPIQDQRRYGKKVTTIFLNIKDAFNYVAKRRLLTISFELGLPISLIYMGDMFNSTTPHTYIIHR